MPTARKLPSGSWRCRVFIGTENGKKKYKSFTSKDQSKYGKKEAEAAAAAFQMGRKTTNKILLFGDACDQYIAGLAPVLSVRTTQSYEDIKRLYLGDLYDTNVYDITQEQVQAVINKWNEKLSPKTVRNIHGFISAVLGKYRPDFKLNTVLPKKVRPKIYVPTDAEIKRLMAYVEGSEMELPILLSAFGPMRRGEIYALQSEDIKGNTVHVCRNSVYNKKTKEWIIKDTKTYAGDRFIEYPDFVAKKWHGIEGQIVKINPNAITKRFAHILKNAGLPHFRFHDLRHYSASIQHALNIPNAYIMQRGGWSSETVLNNIYRHALDDKTKEMNDVANNHFDEMYVTKDDTKSRKA